MNLQQIKQKAIQEMPKEDFSTLITQIKEIIKNHPKGCCIQIPQYAQHTVEQYCDDMKIPIYIGPPIVAVAATYQQLYDFVIVI